LLWEFLRAETLHYPTIEGSAENPFIRPDFPRAFLSRMKELRRLLCVVGDNGDDETAVKSDPFSRITQQFNLRPDSCVRKASKARDGGPLYLTGLRAYV